MHKYYCPRCMVGMVCLGKKHIQTYDIDVFRVPDLIPAEVHICPDCGKIELFAATEDGMNIREFIKLHLPEGDAPRFEEKAFACPSCGEEFSPSLLKCPKCGLDMRNPAQNTEKDVKAREHEESLKKPKRKLPWEF